MKTLGLEAVLVGGTDMVTPAGAVVTAEVSRVVPSAGEAVGRSALQAPTTNTKPTANAPGPVAPMHF
jgi:hypothetical protein